MTTPRRHPILASGLLLLLLVPILVLPTCGGGGGGSGGGATVLPLMSALVAEPAYDSRFFGETVQVRVRSDAPEAGLRVNGVAATSDASGTLWTATLPTTPGAFDLEVEILDADGSVRERGIGRRLVIHAEDVVGLEWYEPDPTNTRLRAVARRRDDGLVFVEFDLVGGGMTRVETAAGAPIDLGSDPSPFTWDAMRDVIYDVEDDAVRRIDVATGVESYLDLGGDDDDVIFAIYSLRYDRIGDALFVHRGAFINGFFDLDILRFPGGAGPATTIVNPSVTLGSTLGMPAVPGAPITFTPTPETALYYNVDPVTLTATASAAVATTGVSTVLRGPAQPDFAEVGAVFTLRDEGLFLDRPGLPSTSLFAAVSPSDAVRPIFPSVASNNLLLTAADGPVLVDRTSGAVAHPDTFGYGPSGILPLAEPSGVMVGGELIGLARADGDPASLKLVRYDPRTNALSETPVTGIGFPGNPSYQVLSRAQLWNPLTGNLITLVVTYQAFNPISIGIYSVDVDTGAATTVTNIASPPFPQVTNLHLRHDRVRNRFLLVTGTGLIYSYDVAEGTLSFFSQVTEPDTLWPYSTGGYVAALDEASDQLILLQSSRFNGGTVTSNVSLEDGSVSIKEIDFSGVLPTEYIYTGFWVGDQAGSVLAAIRPSASNLTDLARIDLVTGTVTLVDVDTEMAPFQGPTMRVWADEADLGHAIIRVESGLYAADVSTGQLTLLAR